MNRIRRGFLIGGGALLLLVAVGAAAVVLLFPPAKVRALVERQASQASGYTIRLADARLRWANPGLAIRVRELSAEAPDGSQSIRAPQVDLRVALRPLLSGSVRVGELVVDGLELTLRPAVAGADGSPASGATAGRPAAPGATGTLLIPRLEIRNGRVVQEGSGGTNTLAGLRLKGSFRHAAGRGRFEGDAGAASFVMTAARGGGVTTLGPLTARFTFEGGVAEGLLKGALAADSLIVVPAVAAGAAARPFRLPGPRTTVECALRFGAAPDARTALTGRLGPLPFTGTVNSRQDLPGPAWQSEGELQLAAVALDSLMTLLPAEALAPLKQYALGGRLAGGAFRFRTRADSDSLDYSFTTRLTGITAALADKGRVIDDGALDVTLLPTRAACAGQLRSGGSTLHLEGSAGMGERAPWQATVRLGGPAAEALRFLPPGSAPQVTAGRLDLDVRVDGRVGDTAPPSATGRLTLAGVAFRTPALAVPVSRLDLRTSFSGDRALIESGELVAGQSSARFKGEVTDFKRPAARLDIEAGTLNLDELFPAPVKGAASPTAPAPPGAAPPAAVPARGRITIRKLVRDRAVLSDVSADYAVTATGMEMEHLVATAWGGRVTGNLTLTPKGAEAMDYSGDFEIADARLSEMLTALTKIRGLDGTIQTTMTLSGQNGPRMNPLTALTLDAKALVLEGVLLNIPAVQKVAQALSLNAAATTSFPFRTMKSRLRVVNGFVNLDSCLVTQPAADYALAGRVGLDGTLDVPIRARISTTLFAGGSDLRKAAELLAGPDGRLPIGLTVGGTLTSPTVTVDLDPLFRQMQDKIKGGAAEELKKRLGGLFKKP